MKSSDEGLRGPDENTRRLPEKQLRPLVRADSNVIQ